MYGPVEINIRYLSKILREIYIYISVFLSLYHHIIKMKPTGISYNNIIIFSINGKV